MDKIFPAPDSEFEVLQEKAKNQTSKQNRSFIGRMLLSLTGNCKTSKGQIAPQKPLSGRSETRASCSINTLDGSYIDRNAVNEVKGSAPVAESETQNVKQLIIWDLNEKCNEFFTELFQNVYIYNPETVRPLITASNSKVRSLLVDIQTKYGFRLCFHDMEHNDMAV